MSDPSENGEADEVADSRYRGAVASSTLFGTLGTAVRSSQFAKASRAVRRRSGTAARESTLASTASTVGQWVRESWLYRWLTAEPDPDVVVIDLRETRTVRPFIIALDWLAARFAQWRQSAAIVDVGRGIRHSLVSEPVRVLGIVLTVALLSNLVLMAVTGSLSTVGVVARAVLLVPAVLAVRVRASWADVRESGTGRLLTALLEPPEPPEE